MPRAGREKAATATKRVGPTERLLIDQSASPLSTDAGQHRLLSRSVGKTIDVGYLANSYKNRPLSFFLFTPLRLPTRQQADVGYFPRSTRNMTRNPVLSLDSINQNVLHAHYAVRGECPTLADELAQRLQEDPKHAAEELGFDEIVYANIGNPQQLEQKPITYIRQVGASQRACYEGCATACIAAC